MFPAETVKEDYCSKSHSLCVWHCPEHCMFPAETVKEDYCSKSHSLCVWHCPEHCMFPAETVKEDYCSKSHSLCVWHCPKHCMFPAETVKEDSFPKASHCAGILTTQIHCLLLCFFLFHLFVEGGGSVSCTQHPVLLRQRPDSSLEWPKECSVSTLLGRSL